MTHALIVEDDADSAETMAALISAQGFTVAIARTMRDARRQIVLQLPDLVLLDLQLPDGSGMDLFQDAQLVANSEIVLITGHASLESSIQALRMGAADYLVKPINMKQLQGILSRVMRPSAIQAELASLTAEWEAIGPFRPPVGPLAADAAHLRADLARRRHGGVGVHHRRERHRQGSRRADRARPEPPPQASVPGRQLRRDLAQPDRERDLRPREGQLHRRRSPAPGLLRARPRRHAVPRRDHRDAARAAGQAAARARDGHVHARRLDRGAGDRRARHRRHQPPARAGGVVAASCAKTCCTA